MPCGRRYSTSYYARRARGQLQAGRPFGHRQPRLTGESGSPSIWMTRAVLHVDVLAAAHRAIRADRLDHLVGRGDPRPELLGPLAGDRRPAAGRVGASRLAVHRPAAYPRAHAHPRPLPIPRFPIARCGRALPGIRRLMRPLYGAAADQEACQSAWPDGNRRQPVDLPGRSEIVVIGGGVVGCSIAYQLARRGKTDVTVLRAQAADRGQHLARGRAGRPAAQLQQPHPADAVEHGDLRVAGARNRLPDRLAPRWAASGSRPATRAGRSSSGWSTTARSFGFEVDLISPGEARELFPLLNTDGMHGATWVPSDGYADPSQLTQSFAAGARAAGVRIIQGCRVTGLAKNGRRVTAVVTDRGRIECESVVNATGMWGAETARLAGADVAVERGRAPVRRDRPDRRTSRPTCRRLRDPDAPVLRQAGDRRPGRRRLGGRHPRPVAGHPPDLGPELFPPDHERFAPLGRGRRRNGSRLPARSASGPG